MTSPRRSLALMHFILFTFLAISPGCPPKMVVIDGEQVPREVAADRTLGHAKAAYEEERYEEAVEKLREYVARFSRAGDVDEARWLLSRSYAALGRDADARRAMRVVIEQHPRSPYADLARMELGAAHLEAGEYREALVTLGATYGRADEEERPRLARMLAEASLGAENWTDAVRWLGEIRRMARDEEARREADAELLDLVDRGVPQTGLARLRQELASDSPALPLVIMKIARIHYHQREYRLAGKALEQYLSEWPRGDFAEDARALRERMARLSEVEPRVVGVILPLSGRARPFGEAALRGLGMALDLSDTSRITLLIRDSEGEADRAAELVEDLVLEEKVIAIVGPLLSGTSRSAAAKAEELGVPLISFARADGLPQMGPWVFRNALSDAAQARALVDYAVEKMGARSFGIMYPNHDYGRGLMHHFWNEVDARQLEVRGVERYDHDETTFQPIVRKMVGRYHLQYRNDYMEEVRRIRQEITDPMRRRRALSRALDDTLPIPEFDVLFVPDSYRTVGLIAPALAVEDVITNVCDERDLERIKETTGREELTKVQLLGPNAWNHQELITRGGRHVRCSVFVDGFFADSTRAETRAFVELYQQMHGGEARPDYLEAHGYDTAAIVRHILEEAAPSDRRAFRDALLRMPAYPGSTGETSFGPDGEVMKSPFLLTVDRDRIVEVDLTAEESPPAG